MPAEIRQFPTTPEQAECLKVESEIIEFSAEQWADAMEELRIAGDYLWKRLLLDRMGGRVTDLDGECAQALREAKRF